jgi:hypothetical protein
MTTAQHVLAELEGHHGEQSAALAVYFSEEHGAYRLDIAGQWRIIYADGSSLVYDSARNRWAALPTAGAR